MVVVSVWWVVVVLVTPQAVVLGVIITPLVGVVVVVPRKWSWRARRQ